MTLNTCSTQAIAVADLSAMLVAPTIPENLLERKVAQLARVSSAHNLDMEATEMVAYIMIEHSAQPSTIDRYLGDGFNVNEVVRAYDARGVMSEVANSKGLPAISILLEAQQYFADSEDPEYFQELLLELPGIYPGLDFTDTVLKVALEEAKEIGIVYLGDFIERRRG